jgi:predicted tellurium resistance membrane protein TerC
MKIVAQIIFLDFIFSFDSVITAVGMTNSMGSLTTQFVVMAVAVVLSYTVILFYANPVGEYIIARPSLKILALAFLVTIGVSIFLDGLNHHVPKQYLYLPMGFALLVQLLQMRYEHKKKGIVKISEVIENFPDTKKN